MCPMWLVHIWCKLCMMPDHVCGRTVFEHNGYGQRGMGRQRCRERERGREASLEEDEGP